jgi:hypothetical protein
MAKWILCSERTPSDARDVLIVLRGNFIRAGYWLEDVPVWRVAGEFVEEAAVVAWLDEVPKFEGEA